MQVVLLTKAVKVPQLKKTLRLPLFIKQQQHDDWLNADKVKIVKNLLASDDLSDIDFS